MAPIMNGADFLSDEEYLVFRARNYQQTDKYATKTWLITAKTLFPRNFSIQFEAYSIEKTNKNVTDASRYLEDLLCEFNNEQALWREVHTVTEALRSEGSDGNSCFLREVFSRLPPEIQYSMLLKTADHSDDTLEHCRLMLLLLKRFPDRTPLHGMKLVETLIAAEKHTHYTNPINCYRRLLVCDILPLILGSPSMEIPPKQLFRLLYKSMDFLICYATQPPQQETRSEDGSIMSNSLVGLLEGEGKVDNPWDQLVAITRAVAAKMNWELHDVFTSNSSRQSQWQRLHNYFMTHPLLGGEEGGQILYTALVLFLWCLFQYSCKINPQQFALSTGSSSVQLYLVEGFRSFNKPDEPSKAKKRRLDADQDLPGLTVGHLPHDEGVTITQNFLTAAKCWELLHSHEFLEKEFIRVLQQLGADEWHWFQEFQVDLLMYQGMFQEAAGRLEHMSAAGVPYNQDKIKLQMASCDYSAGKLSAACKQILSLVNSLPPSSCANNASSAQLSRSARHLVFLGSGRTEILHYCVKMLVTCLQDKSVHCAEDTVIGHLLVLLQYDWPKEEELFLEIIRKIKIQDSFCYELFFNYIINIDMLEEFAYLSTGETNLELVPSPQVSKQRTITRGINKGAREDLRVALEKQVARSSEDLDQTLITFLEQEKNSLQQVLLQ